MTRYIIKEELKGPGTVLGQDGKAVRVMIRKGRIHSSRAIDTAYCMHDSETHVSKGPAVQTRSSITSQIQDIYDEYDENDENSIF